MISVVICTYNPNPVYLQRTVQSVLQQQYRKSDVDFFIVDNNSKIPVRELSFVQENHIHVVVERTPGLTAARECGVRNAKGDIVVFVDDDNILDSKYLQTVQGLFQHSNVGVLSGNVEPEYEVQPERWFFRFEPMIAVRRIQSDRVFLTSIPVFNEYFPIGAGMCIRTDLLREYFQSLDQTNRIEGRVGKSLSSGEDLDIDFFAISRGYLIGSAGALKIKHIIPSFRCQSNYIRRLSVSSTHSSHLINQKWKPVFDGDVFTFFKSSRIVLFFKMVLYALTSWNKRSLILFHFHKKLFSVVTTSKQST